MASNVPGGALVVSLDFELYWGNRDHRPLDACRKNLAGTREVVPKLLALFRRHEIHATWATVGLLFCAGKDEALRAAPALLPTYADPNLSPYRHLASLSDEDAPYHFAPELVRLVARTPHQEVATHTFSHFYCMEPGQTASQFRADLEAAQRIAREKLGRDVVSIVFPRNQVAPQYLGICRDAGLTSFRGCESHAWSHAEARAAETRRIRALRLLDLYLPLSGANASSPAPAPGLPLDIPSSRFLRGYSPRLRMLEPVRLARIVTSLQQTAREGRVFHLWWHPENFGTYPERNLQMLERILLAFGELRRDRGMRSLTMSELASEIAPARAQESPGRGDGVSAASRRVTSTGRTALTGGLSS